MASQKFQLVMRMGPNPGKSYDLTQDAITIGRDVSNHIVINDPEVSRRHTRLSFQSDGYTIADMGSTNGTFVDGQRLMGPHVLRDGETIMISEKVSLVFEALGFDPNATVIGRAVGAPNPQADADTYRVPPSQQRPNVPPIPRTEVVPPAAEFQAPPPEYQAFTPEEPPVYSGQIPPGPAEPQVVHPTYDEPIDSPSKKNKTAILAGCGCLVLVLVCISGAAFAFDYLDLYCTSPFNALSGFLWSCPP